MNDVLIIGGGISGLTAARELAAQNIGVTLLEARPRLGGRIFTIASPSETAPIELGAEFIHGEKNEVWDLLKKSGLRAVPISDDHWRFEGGRLVKERSFWNRIEEVTDKIDPKKDEPFSKFIDRQHSLSATTKKLVTDFVEGFNAADAERISTKALVAGSDSKAFRIVGGYQALVGWMASDLTRQNVTIHTETTVKQVTWDHGEVVVHARTPEGVRTFQAATAIVTVPPSVLRASGAGAIQFQPGLPESKRRVIEQAAIGNVIRIILKFRKRFWEEDGFIHAPKAFLPVWWTLPQTNALVGWVGGPAATRMAGISQEALLNHMLTDVSEFFGLSRAEVESNCEASFYHDWINDPYAGGAYSYAAAGSLSLPHQLAEPVDDTLFFAGEATAALGKEGTVQGAIASGLHSAKQVALALETKSVASANRR